jgi:hypothetical protein
MAIEIICGSPSAAAAGKAAARQAARAVRNGMRIPAIIRERNPGGQPPARGRGVLE